MKRIEVTINNGKAVKAELVEDAGGFPRSAVQHPTDQSVPVPPSATTEVWLPSDGKDVTLEEVQYYINSCRVV